jgi:molecular chaperone GrpE (heat shock protein)
MEEPNAATIGPQPDDLGQQDLARVIAELEGAKARVERDSEGVLDATRQKLLVQLIPVLDNLERAIATADGHADRALVHGVTLVRDQLEGVLCGFGVERFDPTGEPFDPREHDAVALVDVASPELDRKVGRVVQAGYRFGERLLRPARVHVGRYRAAEYARPRRPF